MDIRDYIRLLRRRGLHILLIALVAAAAQAGSFFFSRAPLRYRSSAEMLLKETAAEQGLVAGTGAGTAVVPLKTRIGVITSPLICKRGAQHLAAKGITVSEDEIRSSLEVSSSPDGYNVTVSATTDTPAKSMEIVNATCGEFKNWFREDVTESFRLTEKVLKGQLAKIQEMFDRETQALRTYMSDQFQGGRVRPDLQFEHRLEQVLGLESQRTAVESELHGMERRLRHAVPGQARYEILPETSAGTSVMTRDAAGRSEHSLGLARQVGEQQGRLASLREKYKDEHPAVIALQQDIRKQSEALDLENQLTAEERRAALRQECDALKQRLRDLDDTIGRAWTAMQEMQGPMEGYQDRIAARNTLRAQRQGILEDFLRLEQREALEGGPERVTVVREARPGEPRQPLATVSFSLLVAVSLILGLAGGYLLELLHTSIRTPVDVRNYLDLHTISSIPFVREEKTGLLDLALKSPLYELYNKLATFIEATALEQRARSLLVVSAKAGEGKSTLASNVAIALAQSGERVILVDADLRRPVQHQIFGLDNSRGLSSILAGELEADRRLAESTGRPLATLDHYLRGTPVPTLHVLPSGPAPMNPIHLLKSPYTTRLISELRQRANLIIFDAPPVLGVIDGAILAGLCDLTVLVVAENQVSRGESSQCKHALTQVGANLVGVILNKVHFQPEAYYYYYYRYRGYT